MRRGSAGMLYAGPRRRPYLKIYFFEVLVCNLCMYICIRTSMSVRPSVCK